MSYDVVAFATLSLLLVMIVPMLMRRPIPLVPSVLLAAVLLRVLGWRNTGPGAQPRSAAFAYPVRPSVVHPGDQRGLRGGVCG